jgi:BirA family biotin operon repressor/biotin-[acetyl-CoA-carboxylase] ligase
VKPGEPEGHKICGILAESSAENVSVAAKCTGPVPGDSRLDSVVLGVGLNANLDPEDLNVPERGVTTLRSELGHDVDLVELLGALLVALDAELMSIEDFDAVLYDWRTLNCTLGRPVRVARFGEVLEGRATDLTSEGALLLQTPQGTVELFEGEVEHLRQGGT